MTGPLDRDGKGRPMTALRPGEIIPGLEISEADTVADFGCRLGPGYIFARPLDADVVGIETDLEPISTVVTMRWATTARSSRAPGGAVPR